MGSDRHVHGGAEPRCSAAVKIAMIFVGSFCAMLSGMMHVSHLGGIHKVFKRKRICTVQNGEHVAGEWRKASYAGPPCCGWAEYHNHLLNKSLPDFLNNTRQCGKTKIKKWERIPLYSYSGRTDGFLSHVGGSGCRCHAPQHYAWVPAHCELRGFDARRFCKLLGTRKLAFIGDSTMGQTASAVMNAVEWGYRGTTGGGCQSQLTFGHSDTLIGKPMERKTGDFRGWNRGGAWMTWVKELHPDVVVFSTGPHIGTLEGFAEVLTQLAKDIPSLPAGLQLIWKSQHPGGCGPEPLKALPRDNNTFWETHAGGTYNWRDFPSFDDAAKKFCADPRHNVTMLDMSPMYYRVDSHVDSARAEWEDKGDCLHTCRPAQNLGLVAQLLLHLLDGRT